LIDDIYDYLYGNDTDIGTDFLREFPDSYVDTDNARIYLQGAELGKYIIKIERA
jgi:hypothetical protein